MTSLASLGHGTSTAAPAFNTAFYATAATIIPVLFLAIAVQGSLYSDLLKASAKTLDRFRERDIGSNPPRAWIASLLLSLLAACTAITILIFGVTGDIQALASLSSQQVMGDPNGPLIAAVMLTLASAAGPAFAFVGTVVTISRRGQAGGGAAGLRASPAEDEAGCARHHQYLEVAAHCRRSASSEPGAACLPCQRRPGLARLSSQ
jgi:hypothetical protein